MEGGEVEGKVQVCVRCRPLSTNELVGLGRSCVTVPQSSGDAKVNSIYIGDRDSEKRKAFLFDNVFDEEIKQSDVYAATCQPLVEGLFEGLNASIMAYGQTGSGKTFTMGTAVDSMATEDEGIIPRVVKQIFDTITEKRQADNNKIVNVRVSFLEILNEDCKDLLHPEVQSKDIQIREDSDGHIFFTGAREEAATSMAGVLTLLERGCLARTTAGTNMNAQSSRSHAVFTIGIDMYDVSDGRGGFNASGTASCLQAKLKLVDLAGSERAKKTGAYGERLKQSVSINQGLLALGKVIRALTTSHTRQNQNRPASKKGHSSAGGIHVPYRESKLTRLLQDSLGGNSRTVFIACVSSSVLNLHETLTTLQYASRTKAIRNKVVANVSVAPAAAVEMGDTEAVMEGLRARLRDMESQMASYKQGASAKHLLRSSDGSLRRSWPNFDPSEMAALECMDYHQIAGALRSIRTDLRAALQAVSGADPGTILATAAATSTVRDSRDDIERRFGVAKGLVVTCRDAVTALGTLVERAVSSSVKNTPATNGSGSGSGDVVPAEEMTRLQEELAECREDLVRDEEIFAEKVRELKRVRKENRQLNVRASELERQVHTLETDLAAARASVQIHSASVSAIENHDHSQNRSGSMSSDGLLDVDLDESIALVASTEPDISQLMDDLEQVSREKERLLEEKKKAEEECARMASLAMKQREDADVSSSDMSRRLRELEIGIRMKQNVITTVTSSANEEARKRTAAEIALGRERKAREDAENAFEEATVRTEQSRATQVTMATMASGSNGRNDETNRLQLEVELAQMRREHSRLASALDSNQQKQQRQVEVLTSQVAKQRRASAESQVQIRALEEKNRDLQARLQKVNYSRNKGREAPVSVIPDDASVQSVATLTIDREIMMKRISLIAKNQLLAADMNSTRDKIDECEADLQRLQKEHAHVLRGSGSGEGEYSRAVEVEEEIETLETELELHRTNLTDMQRRAYPQPRRKGASKAAAGAAGGSTVGDNCDQMLADIQRLSEGQSNILLLGAVRDLVAAKFSALREDGTISAVRSKLEEKEIEVDGLHRAMYRQKAEAARRAESIRADSDAKVNFLLQQLRQTERQMREQQSFARRSIEELRVSGGALSLGRQTAMAGEGAGGDESKSAESQQAFEAERRRRELLEKRNGELVRELRQMRLSQARNARA